ncbi:uncharacterized protein LOC125012956 isoform X2 [Mugil cephalus]|uniref:uncharacterized protein LOC125012956 isoform X2 n=1 Tax=Mugil cephalus TaxID=48193 RepID=UPI001FB5FEAA|nr:uncharacterized protein LOC125012956 isoform X2 [Mugil cephalus]
MVEEITLIINEQTNQQNRPSQQQIQLDITWMLQMRAEAPPLRRYTSGHADSLPDHSTAAGAAAAAAGAAAAAAGAAAAGSPSWLESRLLGCGHEELEGGKCCGNCKHSESTDSVQENRASGVWLKKSENDKRRGSTWTRSPASVATSLL